MTTKVAEKPKEEKIEKPAVEKKAEKPDFTVRELTAEEKNSFSMRKIAVEKLKECLHM